MAGPPESWLWASPVWVRGAALAAGLAASFAVADTIRVLDADRIEGVVTGVLEARPETGLLSDLFIFDQGPVYDDPRARAAMVQVTGDNHLGAIVVVRGLPAEQVSVGANVTAWMRGTGQAEWGGPGLLNFRGTMIALALMGIAWFSAWHGTQTWRIGEGLER